MDKTTSELHSVRKKMWDASMANHEKYFDHESGLFAEKYIENRCCPACGCLNERVIFQKSGGTYVACNDCEMVYLNPVFKDEWIEDYYRQNHEVQAEIVAMDSEFYQKLYNKGLDLISKNFSAPGNILDVGCSAGGFLDIAKKSGWKTFGLELNKREAVHSRNKGHAVFENMINNVEINERFEAITLWDVFEHIKDGSKFLNDAKRLLKKNGVIFIQSPTRDALAAKMLKEECNMFDGIEHVNLYGHENIVALATKSGYEIVNYDTVISEIGVMNNYLNFENPYLGKTKNKESLLGSLNEAWILQNKLGYKFQICLKLI